MNGYHVDPIRSQIREVWADNLEEEFKAIRDVVEHYQYIAMDTEFPGIVARPTGSCTDYIYQTVKCNVDLLKVIQLGITFADAQGNLAKGVSTWQFNFSFNLECDMYAQDSIDFLKQSGIDFDKQQKKGIALQDFGELIMSSGLVMNEDVKWISFHGSYDFGYLLKLLTCEPLPQSEGEFFELLHDFFPALYDIKFLLTNINNLDFNWAQSLQKIAEHLHVKRVGREHQAGSDSLITCRTFFKLMETYFDNQIDDSKFSGVIFGLGAASIPKPNFKSTPQDILNGINNIYTRGIGSGVIAGSSNISSSVIVGSGIGGNSSSNNPHTHINNQTRNHLHTTTNTLNNNNNTQQQQQQQQHLHTHHIMNTTNVVSNTPTNTIGSNYIVNNNTSVLNTHMNSNTSIMSNTSNNNNNTLDEKVNYYISNIDLINTYTSTHTNNNTPNQQQQQPIVNLSINMTHTQQNQTSSSQLQQPPPPPPPPSTHTNNLNMLSNHVLNTNAFTPPPPPNTLTFDNNNNQNTGGMMLLGNNNTNNNTHTHMSSTGGNNSGNGNSGVSGLLGTNISNTLMGPTHTHQLNHLLNQISVNNTTRDVLSMHTTQPTQSFNPHTQANYSISNNSGRLPSPHTLIYSNNDYSDQTNLHRSQDRMLVHEGPSNGS